MKYRISRRADADIESVCAYVAEQNADAAERLDEQIHQAIKMLARFPGLGHNRADVDDERYLFRAVGNYVIAYRVERNQLIVVRVLHGARDFRELFRRKK